MSYLAKLVWVWGGSFCLFLVECGIPDSSKQTVSLAVTAQDCHQKESTGSAHAAFHITNWERNK